MPSSGLLSIKGSERRSQHYPRQDTRHCPSLLPCGLKAGPRVAEGQEVGEFWPAPLLTRLILRLAAPAHRVLVPVGAPDSVPVAPLPVQLSAVARECSGGWPRCLGPAPTWETRISTWLLPSDQRGAPAAVRRPRRPLEGEPTAKGRPFSLSLSLTVHSACQKKKKKSWGVLRMSQKGRDGQREACWTQLSQCPFSGRKTLGSASCHQHERVLGSQGPENPPPGLEQGPTGSSGRQFQWVPAGQEGREGVSRTGCMSPWGTVGCALQPGGPQWGTRGAVPGARAPQPTRKCVLQSRTAPRSLWGVRAEGPQTEAALISKGEEPRPGQQRDSPAPGIG
nr:uncharacterized protein LOC127490196 [Oryctolagus cuniculus]